MATLKFKRGRAYVFTPSIPVTCENCGVDTSKIATGKVLTYMGRLNRNPFFVYDDPAKCPNCGMFQRWHTLKMPKTIDKK